MPPAVRSTSAGWVPTQHGAWAMLATPFLGALILRARAGDWQPYLAPLAGSWVLGYFAFHAGSGWLKAPHIRRGRYLAPLITYTAASGLLGAVAVLLVGWGLLGWGAVYAPLLAGALWLAHRRRERVVLGGALTVAAASAMTLVARFPSPSDVASAWPDEASRQAFVLTTALFAYFFGTVLYVKTMIRERGRPGRLALSIAWHAIAALGFLALGRGTWFWSSFFALATIRAATLPWVARRRPVSPKQVGLVEVVFSILALTGACWS